MLDPAPYFPAPVDAVQQAWSESSALTRELLAAPDTVRAVRGIVKRSLHLVAFDGASVTLWDSGSTHFVTTDDDVLVAEELQHQLGDGPRVDQHDHIVSEGLAGDPRWPSWGYKVAELGMVGLVSLRLATAPGLSAVVNLYSRAPRPFTRADLVGARAVAAQVSRALHPVTGGDRDTTAIGPSTVVGLAQTMAMIDYGLNADQAFELLSRLAQDNDLALDDVARQLLRSHEPLQPSSLG